MARYEQGDLKGAILDYDRSIEIDPRDALAFSNRGTARWALRDLSGAIAEFDRAIEAFGSILGTPVKLRTRRDLHQGFLRQLRAMAQVQIGCCIRPRFPVHE